MSPKLSYGTCLHVVWLVIRVPTTQYKINIYMFTHYVVSNILCIFQ